MLFGICCIAVHHADSGWDCGGGSAGRGLRDVGAGYGYTEVNVLFCLSSKLAIIITLKRITWGTFKK